MASSKVQMDEGGEGRETNQTKNPLRWKKEQIYSSIVTSWKFGSLSWFLQRINTILPITIYSKRKWTTKMEIDSWTLFHRIDTNRFPFCRLDPKMAQT